MMGVKQELELVAAELKNTLDECNAALSIVEASNFKELPSCITVSNNDFQEQGYNAGFGNGMEQGREIGYNEGYEAGKEAGGEGSYETGFAAGYDQGMGEGLEVGRADGIEIGVEQQYSAYWDTYQDNGNRTVYPYAFYYTYWRDGNFKPKYDMRPTNAQDMYSSCGVTDLKGILETQGVVLDFSGCTNMLRAMHGMSSNKRLGVIDMSAATDVRNVFMNDLSLQSIDKLVFSETTGSQYNSTAMFQSCNSLTSLTAEGVICFSVDFHWSPLDRQSMESIIAALSTTTTGLTATFKKTAVEAAFTTDEWTALCATRSNWTIAKA